ncbi:MAG: type I-C CRISPR-associated protein Cas8c/Csd1 [Gammaproteobacteria bacterium]|nr:type I-C CRISPR-associated protein Cas8c/Csd1 [Gammaproteobacteria bacterium]
MSILQALVGHYDRLVANDKAPEYGYSFEAVSFGIVLSRNGEVVDVLDLRDTSGKTPRPSRRLVPRPAIRAANVVSNFLWDKTAYVLGVKSDRNSKTPIPAQRGEHADFRQLHLRLLAGTDDSGLNALLAFLEKWNVEDFGNLARANDMLDTNIVFRFDGDRRFIHERPAARHVWQDHLAAQDQAEGHCLVTGELGPVQRLHPKIKGVKGAQSSGASLVSFNLGAFESFGRRQGNNAPISEQAVFAYTTTLNTLLARASSRNIQIGDATTVFWAEAAGVEAEAEAAEDLFSILAEPEVPTDAEEAVKVADKLSAVADGRPLADVQPGVNENTRFFVLGLAPNAARLSVRFWYEGSIGSIARRIGEHWRDMRLEPSPWTTPPAVWRLLLETAAQRRSANIPPALGGALMRAILTGGRYPHSLLAALVARMRADKDINGRRVAICKGCLARDYRLGFEEEDVPMSLNPDEKNVAYRLGRLFAVYESVQRAALGNVNTTIKDRYFGAASATPASVFPLLERSSANHLASLRKSEKGGLAHWFDREIDLIVSGLDTDFPRSLRLEEQGRFAIGYHHQRATRRVASDRDSEGGDTGIDED